MQSTLSPEIALHLHLGVAVAVEMVSSCIGSFVVWLVQASSMMSYTPFNQFFYSDDNCESLQCSHGCNETSVGPMCYCPGGYELGDNEQTCQGEFQK